VSKETETLNMNYWKFLLFVAAAIGTVNADSCPAATPTGSPDSTFAYVSDGNGAWHYASQYDDVSVMSSGIVAFNGLSSGNVASTSNSNVVSNGNSNGNSNANSNTNANANANANSNGNVANGQKHQQTRRNGTPRATNYINVVCISYQNGESTCIGKPTTGNTCTLATVDGIQSVSGYL
jgi:hypothetical protein